MERLSSYPFSQTSSLNFFQTYGFTLFEILISLALIMLVASALLASGNYLTQVQKSHDARRKSDLALFKTKMEDYYNDHNRYPASSEMSQCGISFMPYFNTLPCDPKGEPYYYEVDSTGGQWFRLYTKLENTKDPDIEALGCASGCGPDGRYNYGVASPNKEL